MLKKILLIFSIFILSIANVFAAPPWPWAWPQEVKEWALSEYWSWWYITITVSEPLPWMDCFISESWWQKVDKWLCTIAPWKDQEKATLLDFNCPASMTYQCIQPKWFNWFTKVMSAIIGYLVHLLIIIAVLSIVVFGIMLSMSWVNPNFKSTIKNALMKALIWILLLFLWAYILYLIAPWVYNAK